jgi:predicted MFS family arabinose efflux permease
MLTQWAGWEWVLFVNVPIGIVAALLSPRLLPESRTDGARHFDIAGAVSVTAGLSLLVYSLVNANKAGWGSVETLVLIAAALVLIAGFVVIERRTRAPLVPFPGIFRLRSIRGINITALLIAMALFSMFFFISLYMQQVLGYGPLKAGVSYLPLAGGIIVSAGVASQLVTRFGVKPVLVSGLLLTAGGLVWFAQISVGGSYLSDILGPSLLSAFGLGLAFVAMTVAAVAGVEGHESGLASGLINTSQQVGGALGLAILAAVSDSKRDSVLASVHSLPLALTDGFRTALTVGAGFAVLGAILAYLLVDKAAVEENVDGELVPVTT